MPRYINADTLKQRLLVGSELDPEPCKGFRSALLAMVDTQEDADVRENVNAYWEERTMMNLSPNWKITVCSACKQEPYYDDVHGYILTDFCPNCGAQMDERRDDE